MVQQKSTCTSSSNVQTIPNVKVANIEATIKYAYEEYTFFGQDRLIRVTKAELVALEIADKISGHSRMIGEYAYLIMDDVEIFMDAKKKQNPGWYEIRDAFITLLVGGTEKGIEKAQPYSPEKRGASQ